MKEARPDANGPLGIEADVVDNYVRSLAGCVSIVSILHLFIYLFINVSIFFYT